MVLFSLLMANLVWIIYSLTEGMREGFYWHYENSSKRVCDFNLNPVFHLQRSIVLMVISGFLVHITGYYSLFSTVCMIMMFSFFHNGTYYYTREKLSEGCYQKGWKDESKTLPPHLTFLMSYKKRTTAFILGVVLQIFLYIFLL